MANDKTVTITHQGLYKDVKIEQVHGTVYQFTVIETGRPFVALGPDGERSSSTRAAPEHFPVDTLGDADLDNHVFLGDESDPDVAGRHPVFVGGFDFCDRIR